MRRGDRVDHTQAAGKQFSRCDPTGKVAYLTRRDARIARRRMARHDGHLNAYRCACCDYWHLGNLSTGVIAGEASRAATYYGDARNQNTDHLTVTHPEVPDMNDRIEETETAAVDMLLSDHPYDVATTTMREMLADLTTYRFIPQVPVTPAFAKLLLALNAENQRSHRQAKSDQYARDMSTGRWTEENGQAISIATNGRVINGQHRLWAVVKAKTTVRFDFNMGADPSAIVNIDAGPGRSAMDVIRTAGGGDLSGTASVVRWVLMYEMGIPTGRGGRYQPTPMELSQRYVADPGLFDAAAARGGDAYARGLTTKAVAGTAYYLFAKLNKAVADDLFEQIVSGLKIEGGELGAAYQLRTRLFGRTSAKLARHEQLALFMRAWNLYNTVKGGRRVPVKGLIVSSGGPLTNDNFPRLRQPALPTLPGVADDED